METSFREVGMHAMINQVTAEKHTYESYDWESEIQEVEYGAEESLRDTLRIGYVDVTLELRDGAQVFKLRRILRELGAWGIVEIPPLIKFSIAGDINSIAQSISRNEMLSQTVRIRSMSLGSISKYLKR
jgi:hypothetical protein